MDNLGVERVGSDGPIVSVLITAFNPRRYFAASLSSALRQDLSPEKFEVVVVYRMPETLREVLALTSSAKTLPTVRTVQSDAAPVGETFVAGLRHCRGKYVSFLNDDDTWSTNKLSSTCRAFDDDPTLGMHRHQVSFVDAQGQIMQWRTARHNRRLVLGSRAPKHSLTIGPDPTASDLRRAAPLLPMFNDSSMTLSYGVLAKFQDELSRARAAEDVFLFYLALCSHTRIRLSAENLGEYRIHPSNASFTQHGTSTGTKVYVPSTGALQTLDLIVEMARQSGSRPVARAAERLRIHINALNALRSENNSRLTCLQIAGSYLPYLFDWSIPQNLATLGQLFMGLISPSLTNSAFTKVASTE